MFERLREIAEAATPGPWELDGHSRLRSAHPALHRAGGAGDLQYSDGSGWEHDGDLEHIAAFDPPTVLALLDVAEAAEARNEHDVVSALARLREATHAR